MATNEVVPANAVMFSELCAVLDGLFKKKKQRQDQDRILGNFVNEFRIKVANVAGKKNASMFPIIRLLLPDKERERSAYNMKETKLGKLLVKVLSCESSPDAQKLLNFRSVNSQESDFAGVAYFVFKYRMSLTSGRLTIGDVNAILDKIAAAEVGNKGPYLDEAMSYVIQNLSPEEMKWFLRMILKDLKLGMSTTRILAAFHPDAPDIFESCSNLSVVCDKLKDGDTRPPEQGIQVFYAVSPMLSERLDVTHRDRLPADRAYHIETKFDGERFQMHMENGVFEYFSRKGFTYADNYGKTYDSGLLTPHLKGCFSPSVNSFILDGEMMGWHKLRQCFGSKGMAFDIKKVTQNSNFRPCYCAFDVLYYNGRTLAGPPEKGGLPLSERLKLLDSMFADVPGVIQHSKRQNVKERSDIVDALNKAIEDQDEGIVVKDTESYYLANRRNAGWYKIKVEYTKNTMNDLDLVIIGADEAENKRQGRAKSFHVACADVVAPGSSPHRWVSVGRVATGLSFEERERVCAALEKNWVPARGSPAPHTLVFNKEKPDFWVMPEHSIVVQVRATELIRVSGFGTSYTLRFPRVVKLREDKPYRDVMTLDEFNQLVAEKGPVVKLGTKQINPDQLDPLEVKRRKRADPLQVPEQFRTKRAGEVEVTSKALLGRKICILSDDEDCGKPELVRIVESHGGKHVENSGADTWCCIVGRTTGRVRRLIDSKLLDITTTSWLRSLPSSQILCKLSPLDMLSVKNTTRLALSRDFDAFGDSYTEFVDEDTLKKCFAKMDKEEPEIYLTNEEMLNMDELLYDDNNPFSFLRPCFIHFDDTNSLYAIRARMYGASVCDTHSPNLTHIVVSKRGKITPDTRVSERNVDALVVTEEWLEACFAERRLVSENEFLVL